MRTVKGKPHATQADHYDVLPSPPRTATPSTRSSFASSKAPQEMDGDDINRDPESSEDEQAVFKYSANQTDGTEDEISAAKATFKHPTARPSPASSKRSHDSDQLSSEGDGIFLSQGSAKRQKSKGFNNIHASKDRKRYGAAQRRQSQQKKDGQQAKSSNSHKEEQAPTIPQFKKRTPYSRNDAEAAEMAPAFKDARNRDDHTRDIDDRGSLSPSLSSLSDPPSSPEVEEIQHLDLPAPQTYVAQTECSFCGRVVDKSLKERFEDEHLNGKDMTYKWQERFCLYHRRHDARDVYEERAYPKIDWDELESRMERHREYLRNIIRGLTPSYHRDLLSEKLKGRARSAKQTLNSDDAKKGAAVGYYGPRGEKLM